MSSHKLGFRNKSPIVSKLVRGVVATGVSGGTWRIVSVLLTIVIARVLGPESLGTYAFVMTTTGMLVAFSDFGMSRSLQKYVHEPPTGRREDTESICFYLRSFGAVATAAVVLAIEYAFSIFRGQGLLISIIVLFSIFNLAATIFNARLEFRNAAITQTSVTVTFFVASVALIITVRGIGSVLIAFALSPLIVGAPLFLAYFKPRLSSLLDNVKLVSPIVKFGFMATALSVLSLAASRFDIILLTYLLGEASTGIYRGALALAGIVLFVGELVRTPLLPIVSNQMSEGTEQEFLQAHAVITRYLLAVLGVVLILGLVFADAIVETILGTTYSSAVPVFKLLLITNLAASVTSSYFSVLYMRERLGYLIKLTAWIVVLNICGNLLLIPRMGITGAALATLGSQICGTVLLIWHFNKVYAFSVKRIFYSPKAGARSQMGE